MTNAIYEFVPAKNKVTVVFEHNSSTSDSNFLLNLELMHPLSGLACSTDRHNIYLFGGKNEDKRVNDLWKFDLKTLQYEKLPAAGDVPAVRNGHTMTYYNDRLYVFGGIHDITW